MEKKMKDGKQVWEWEAGKKKLYKYILVVTTVFCVAS